MAEIEVRRLYSSTAALVRAGADEKLPTAGLCLHRAVRETLS